MRSLSASFDCSASRFDSTEWQKEVFLRFITKRATSDIDVAYPQTECESNQQQTERRAKLNQMENLIRNCELSLLMHELNGSYVLMEEYFLKESALKAIQLDTIEPPGSLTSSMLDDIFFIIKKCIKRALSGGSIDVVCAIINHSVCMLESSFCDAMNERLRYGYPNTITGAATAFDLSQAYNAIQTGRYLQSASEVEKAKTLFHSALNNLDTACENIKTLKSSINEDVKKASTTQKQNYQKEKLETCFSDLVSLTGRFKTITTSGLSQLCSAVFKPRIKTWIDAFISCNHILTEDDMNAFESTDGLRPHTQSFIISIDCLIKSVGASLTPNNSDTLLSLFSTELTQRLSDAVMKCTYNKVSMH